MWTIERLTQHIPDSPVLHEFVVVYTNGHKGSGPEWSLGSVIICLVVLKIEKYFSPILWVEN